MPFNHFQCCSLWPIISFRMRLFHQKPWPTGDKNRCKRASSDVTSAQGLGRDSAAVQPLSEAHKASPSATRKNEATS